MNQTIRNLTVLLLASAFALGPIAAAIAAPAASTTPDQQDGTASDQPVTDAWITTKVKTELATTDGVSALDINVDTRDGVVSLIGVLPDGTAVDKAIAAARSIKGVREVDSSGLKVK